MSRSPMSRFVHIALAVLVPALCATAQARTVRTIPEARALTHADFVSPVDFELRGKLLFAATEYRVPSDRSIVIEQNGQRLMLHTSKERPVKIPAQPGDTVVLRGQTEFRDGIYNRFRIDSVEVAEHGKAPQPYLATVADIQAGLHDLKIVALLQIVDTSLPGVAATRPNTALALWGRARPAGHPAARIAA